jgi:hypothetical protein
MTTATKKPASKNGKAPKADEHGVSEVSCPTPRLWGEQGAIFEWRCIVGDPQAPLSDPGTHAKLCHVTVYVIPSEHMEERQRNGLDAYRQVVDMGNGFHAVSHMRFMGMYEEWNAQPDADHKELVRPFRDVLLELLENNPRVGHCQMETFVNGNVRFKFEVKEDPEGDNPDLCLTLERGDN